jgi:hypothetical protein
MTRRIALSIALALSVALLSLMNADSTARAQTQNRRVADTGVVTLGADQILRITVVNRGKAASNVRFRMMKYSQNDCNGGVCKYELVTETSLPVVELAPGEAASMDVAAHEIPQGLRGVAFMDYTEDAAVAQIIDSGYSRVVSAWDLQNNGN